MAAARFNLKEKTFILFVASTLALNFRIITASLSSGEVFSYTKFLLLYLLLFLVSAVLLIIHRQSLKKIAWIIALASSAIFLFNPVRVPVNPDYFWGSIPSLVKAIMLKEPITAVVQLSSSIIPLLVIVYSILELKKSESKKSDLRIAVAFSILFCISLFADEFFLGIFAATSHLQSIVFSAFYIAALLVWSWLDKNKEDKPQAQ